MTKLSEASYLRVTSCSELITRVHDEPLEPRTMVMPMAVKDGIMKNDVITLVTSEHRTALIIYSSLINYGIGYVPIQSYIHVSNREQIFAKALWIITNYRVVRESNIPSPHLFET